MKKQIMTILLSSLAVMSFADAAEYSSIQPEKSSLAFVYKQMGVPIDGNFKRFSVQLNFDPAKLTAAKAALDIDLSSIDAGSDDANDEVVGKEWFNTKAFPHAKFESSGFKSLGTNRYEVTGKMTIKGRSQIVSAPFTFSPQGLVDGAFILKRADYAIGEGSWSDFGTVANEIQIKFHFLAKAK